MKKPIHKHINKLSTIAVLVISASTVSNIQAGELIGLGSLPGYDNSFANSISDDGKTVAGVVSNSQVGNEQVFRWTRATGMQGIGFIYSLLSLPSSGTDGSVRISADGKVITGFSTSPNSTTEAFRWTEATGMSGLGDLPGGLFWSVPYGISGDGNTIVGISERYVPTGNQRGWQGFIWKNGLLSAFNTPSDIYVPSRIYATNQDGTINAGSMSTVALGNFQARWSGADASTYTQIPDIPGGGTGGLARAISADGNIIVGDSVGHSGTNQAYRYSWSNHTLTPLGDLDQGSNTSSTKSSIATAVSSDGTVVAGYSLTSNPSSNGNWVGFIWQQSTGMQNIRTLLENEGVNTSGWNLYHISDVAKLSDGRIVVVGDGNHNGHTEGFYAVIDGTTCPIQ